MKTDSFAPYFEEAQKNESFWEQMKVLEFSELVADRLEAAGLSHSDLAEKMSVSRAYITKLMSGGNNFTIRSMVKIARALGSELSIDLKEMNIVRQTTTAFVVPSALASGAYTNAVELSWSAPVANHEELALAA